MAPIRRGLSLTIDIVSGTFDEERAYIEQVMARASTAAMDEARNRFLQEGRANIAAAGFGRNWQQTLRATRYPDKKRELSMTPALYIYHRIGYSGVFEDGATIPGSPLMWIALPNVPKRVSRRRITPSRLAANIGQKLVSLKNRKGTPLLGAVVRLPKTRANEKNPKVSLNALRRGPEAKRGVLRTIPLFFGIRQVTHKKRFDIRGIAERTAASLPSLYNANFKEE